MRIYNYLFYKSFVLAKKSKNFEGFPVFGGLLWTFFCATLNFFTIILFFEGLGIKIGFDFLKYRWLFAFVVEGLILFYYCYKGRYKKIIKHYEDKKDHNISIHPVIVIILYYVVSVGLIFLAGFFKHKMWIFAQ